MKDPNGKRRRGAVFTNLHQWQNHYLKPLRNWKRGEGWTECEISTSWQVLPLVSAACRLQSCATSSWAYNIILSCASCSPFAQNVSGRPVSESMLAWNCSVLWVEQLSERREEGAAHMSLRFIHICISLFPAPSFGRRINKHLAPTYTRQHRSPSFTASSVGADQNLEVRNRVCMGSVPSGTDCSVTEVEKK